MNQALAEAAEVWVLVVPDTEKGKCVTRRTNMGCCEGPGWLGLES